MDSLDILLLVTSIEKELGIKIPNAAVGKQVFESVATLTAFVTERMEANQEAMQNLYDNMSEYGYDLTVMPFVVQYNKRDLPNASPVKDLHPALNPGWEVRDPARQRIMPDPYHAGENLVEQIATGEWVEHAPYFEACAVSGDGVFDTLKAVSKLVLKTLA